MKLQLYGPEERPGGDNKATIRKLKVYYGSYYGGNYSRHPVIRVGGNYLRAAGFKIGDNIEIKLSRGKIEITRLGLE